MPMTSDKLQIGRLAILGVGLIGGSLARALKRAGACDTIVGSGRNEKNLHKAVGLGVIDEFDMDPAAAVRDADMIVLAVPLSATAALLKKIRGSIGGETTITDVGSAKGCVVKAVAGNLDSDQSRRFVPGHPIAGCRPHRAHPTSADR